MEAALVYLIPLLKYAAGPVLVWLLRTFAPKITAAIPGVWQPIIAAALNLVIAIVTGADVTQPAAAFAEALNVIFVTGGVVKFADMARGRTRTASEGDKKILTDLFEVSPKITS